LRIFNWVKYCLTRPVDAWPDGIVESLAQQLLWLEVNLEYHVLANHFLKNGKALLFGGAFFSGATAERLFRKGLDIMLGEASEQFLADGGHYERSPQYHCICAEDYVDAIAFFRVNPGLCDPAELAALSDTAERALTCLSQIVAGDGRIPLFNDCAFRIAPEPADLLKHGARVVDGAPAEIPTGPVRIDLPDSGYFGYRKGPDSFLIDCGPVGPEYQPGHAHCDTLSYELCIDGQRVVVDSGVYEYAGGQMREYVRSTAAHNTVRVDEQDQSEMWGEFRVARRASPIRADLSEWDGPRLTFRGAHDGFRRLPGKVIHEREVHLDTGGQWTVRDTVTGRGTHAVQSFVHLHPSIVLQADGDSAFDLVQQGRVIARIEVAEAGSVSHATGWFCPEFGRREQGQVLVLEASGALPLTLSYQISRHPGRNG
jgi:uncharacterized heparinase superfamily protein